MKVWVFEGDKEEILIIRKANMEITDGLGDWMLSGKIISADLV
jgi:hypothetical protein